jgi:hypothetical protein
MPSVACLFVRHDYCSCRSAEPSLIGRLPCHHVMGLQRCYLPDQSCKSCIVSSTAAPMYLFLSTQSKPPIPVVQSCRLLQQNRTTSI